MSAKLWTNVTKHVQKLVSESVAEDDAESVMGAWKKQKPSFMKLVSSQDESGTSTKRSGKRKTKDPNAPKKASSSYIFFCKDAREVIKRDSPDMKATDVIRELGRRWKALSDKERVKYDKLSQEDKVRYAREMESYTPTESPEEDVSEGKKKRGGGRKKQTGPKKPTSAYLFYCADVRSQLKEDHPDKKMTDLSKMMGKMWKELPEEEKRLFHDRAAQDKERYQREVADSEVVEAPEEEKKVVKKTTTKKKTVTKKSKNSQQKKGKTGYLAFCAEKRPELKEENPTWKGPQVTKKLSKMWNSLTEEEQDEWNTRETVTK